ncbi:MAG: aldo/keto reductase [Pelagibacterales bacterium]|nr:aldo/keto reductase [Pelagibacterales bacterium]
MRVSSIKKNIIIGTAQLGTNYGIANTEKNININEKIKFLNFSYNNKLTSFDTAYAYKDSHRIIGKWIREYKLNPVLSSKIPNLKLFAYKSIDIIFNEILKELNVKKLKNLFLHNPKDWNNKEVKKFIINILDKKLITQFGLSIYEKKDIIKDPLIKIIQIPGNIFNQEILLSEELNKFLSTGGKIQIRSILIQGLLTINPSLIPSSMQETKEGVLFFQNVAKELNVNNVHLAILCINYLIPNAKIIIGIDNTKQIKDLLNINASNIQDSDIQEILKVCRSYSGEHWDPRNWYNKY